jgi:hypothetical protein
MQFLVVTTLEQDQPQIIQVGGGPYLRVKYLPFTPTQDLVIHTYIYKMQVEPLSLKTMTLMET